MSNQRDKLNDRDNILTIIQSCDKILSYTEGMEWDDFIQKSYIVDACAMNCLVIGERAAKLSYEFRPTTLEYCQYVLDDYDSHNGIARSKSRKRMFGLR